MFRILLSIFIILIQPIALNAANCANQNCVAMIDAGSTGSRLYVYAFERDSNQKLINIHSIWSKQITPGCATLPTNQDDVNNYLSKLLDNAPYKNIPIYFYATGGMRLLSEPQQEILYKYLQTWFANHLEWKLQAAKTIPGKDEGMYAWIAENYSHGYLTGSDSKNSFLGLMDMGGASVQLVLPIKDNANIDKDDRAEFTIHGQRITLFVHSFLGVGATEVGNQFLNEPSCFSMDYELANGARGAGDTYRCEYEISEFIESTYPTIKAMVKQARADSLTSTLYTVGGLAHLAEELPFTFENEALSSEKLLQQTEQSVCQKSIYDLFRLFPDNHYIQVSCFLGSYYYALLVNGYGLSPDELIHYDKNQPSWTLGALIYQDWIDN